MAFPLGLDEVRLFRQPVEGERFYAVMRPREDGETFDGRVLDSSGAVYLELQGYRTVARPQAGDHPA